MDLSTLGVATPLLVLALGTVAGVVEGVKRAFDKDLKAFVTILASGIVGGLLGFVLPFDAELGTSVVMGLVIGFSATGYITIFQNIGKDR